MTGDDLDLDGSVSIGTIMNGFTIYDTDTPDLSPGIGLGIYDVISISMTFGNYTFTHNPDATESAQFVIHPSNQAAYDVRSWDPSFLGTIYINGEPKTSDDVSWEDYGMTVISLRSDRITLPETLPTSFPPLSDFDGMGFGVEHDTWTEYFKISGEITSINVIPEPGTVLFLALGSVLLLRRRKKRA